MSALGRPSLVVMVTVKGLAEQMFFDRFKLYTNAEEILISNGRLIYFCLISRTKELRCKVSKVDKMYTYYLYNFCQFFYFAAYIYIDSLRKTART